MSELVVISLDEADAAATRTVLNDAHGIHTALLHAVPLERKSAGRVRRWLGLPWRATSALAVASLTAVTWTSLIVGAISGEVAGWLMGRHDHDVLPEKVARTLQGEKTNLIL